MSQSRRDFLKTTTTAAAGAATMPYWFTAESAKAAVRSANEQLVIGCIGTGDRWKQDPFHDIKEYGDFVALCDADANHLNEAKDIVTKHQSQKGRDVQVETHEDYRKVLDRNDIDVVTVVTTDHWHSKIAIEAMQAGKDVYCEKPLTLTILEGKQIIKTLEATNRVFQVGTQQRTNMNRLFLRAIAIIRDGRIGEIKKVTCDIGGSPTCDSIPQAPVPSGLNWDLWLGQAPEAEFRFKEGGRWGNSRCHYEFRWWYEYSGGKLTDWGAHHVDIAQWAMEQNGEGQGPISVEGTAEHPVPFENGFPTQDDRYNCAHKFDITAMFPNGVEMKIVSHSPDGNGILFEGTKGKFHVSRGRIAGAPFKELETNPLPEGALEKLYGVKELPKNHVTNFVDCVKSRNKPISDVWSHHRALTTCHLSNIAIRLGRKLEWDPKTEQITNDADANKWQTREQRKGFEIDVPV
ncbi:MAG TPA: Gfo/Idh/MocA family oxidoreductase [Planctomycetaceae bacterium]|nr:Gfo/Idh/MocA family oxidoreductase [Planctomycetaceae bacterium]